MGNATARAGPSGFPFHSTRRIFGTLGLLPLCSYPCLRRCLAEARALIGDPTRVGRDAGLLATEVVAHLSGLVGSVVKVTLELEAHVPSGVPDTVVRTVMENCRTLKFKDQGFEDR